MSQLWQTCIPCKNSLNTCRLLAQHGITPTHPGISRVCLQKCLAPCTFGCWQAKCLILNVPHLQHCVLQPSQMKMDTVSATENMEPCEIIDSPAKQQLSPGSVKRPHSENSGKISSKTVERTVTQTSKLFRMDAHLHPQLLASCMQQTSVMHNSQAAFHTSGGSSNELKLNETTANTQAKRKIAWTPELMMQQLRRLRHWEPVKANYSSGHEFTLMSYNILAQRLLEYNDGLYRHCEQEVLDWPYRCERILKELEEATPDIVCLQEVQEDHLPDHLLPKLRELGYVGLYKKRTGDKNDGCAVFFKEDKFALEGWLPIEFNKPGVDVLDRDNIGIVALLRPLHDKKSDARLCVATTHLLFNPRRGDIKLAQLQVLFAEMDRLAFRRLSRCGRPLYHPVIVCGDMNSEPYSEIYKFLSSGWLRYEGLPIATMSGQEESRRSRGCLSCELLPPYLGITDHCQFAKIQAERLCNCGPESCERVSIPGESTSSQSRYSEAGSRSYSPTDNYYFSPVFSSGVMYHNFNLMSVYNHRLSRRPHEFEITTQHTRASCTVDYIFYSVKNKRSFIGGDEYRREAESDLKLLSRYSLVSDKEIVNLGGLPNAVCPSDHLPLIARFSLEL